MCSVFVVIWYSLASRLSNRKYYKLNLFTYFYLPQNTYSTQIPCLFICSQFFFLSKWIKVDLGLHFLGYARCCSGQYRNLNLWNKGLGMYNKIPTYYFLLKEHETFIHMNLGSAYSFGLCRNFMLSFFFFDRSFCFSSLCFFLSITITPALLQKIAGC